MLPNIVHNQSIDLETMVNIAVLVDYFEALKAVELFASMWFQIQPHLLLRNMVTSLFFRVWFVDLLTV